MEVDISPITLETTKQLARLYPTTTWDTAAQQTAEPKEHDQKSPSAHVLDCFFAADFITPKQRHRNSDPAADQESYGVQYVRYLHRFRLEQQRRDPETGAAGGFVRRIVSELAGRSKWEQPVRERILAQAIIVQARIEAGVEEAGANELLAAEFGKSRLPGCLWRSIQLHLASDGSGEKTVVRPDELEVAVELLYLVYNWSRCARAAAHVQALGLRSVQRVCLALELFTRYSKQTPRKRQHKQSKAPGANSSANPNVGSAAGNAAPAAAPAVADVGRVQRIRLGHKALLLLNSTWGLLVGDEASALRRLGDEAEADSGRRQGLRKTSVARDALRQIRDCAEKYPQLGDDTRAQVEQLLPFVHPFDGHLTRTAQLPRFGPIQSKEPAQQPAHLMGSPSTQMLLADMISSSESLSIRQLEHDLPEPTTAAAAAAASFGPPPRAAMDSIRAYVAGAHLNRSEREYAEWWRRLVRARGMPLSLTMNGGRGSDVTVNYSPAQSPRFAFCGIVEAEDLPALEMALDGRADSISWPAGTEPEPDADIKAALYRAVFPLLPSVCRALVRTIANWSPAERELPLRAVSLGPASTTASTTASVTASAPQVSDITCLGVVGYPSWREPAFASTASTAAGPATPSSPLGGSNVKRLDRAPSSMSIGSLSVNSVAATGRTMAEMSARLLTQYAQWQAVGQLLMRMILGLQANHVLQVDYMAQLLMNENFIPAVFWWLGTADFGLCSALPPALRRRSFTAEYAREQQRLAGEAPSAGRASSDAAMADPTAVGADSGDASDTASASGTDSDADERPTAWQPALEGICDCLRGLRRLTSHNGLRKGLLYKNKALYFYARAIRVPYLPARQITAELYRDIMPVVSKKQKMAALDVMAHVYQYAPPSLMDAFWLSDYALDPQIEMHRHVELLRLLHFYHHEQFALRLPKDPALFPSLVGQAVEGLSSDSGSHPNQKDQKQQQQQQQQQQPGLQDGSQLQKSLAVRRKDSSLSAPSSTVYSAVNGAGKLRKKSAMHSSSAASSCGRQSGAAVGEYSWLLWESDLEDALNDVYRPKS
ncbi:hypothetical protein GGF40_002787 [Coemansia sp. RSA 1286]|nr:hypothetical protein GGF40_002787 [Coemansia sp. RSA 1286]